MPVIIVIILVLSVLLTCPLIQKSLQADTAFKLEFIVHLPASTPSALSRPGTFHMGVGRALVFTDQRSWFAKLSEICSKSRGKCASL